MQAEQFLDLLEHHGLLDDDVIRDLRDQVRQSQGRATPDAIAKLLVENGYLTQLQANKIMDELGAAPAPQQQPGQQADDVVEMEDAEPASPPPPPANSGLTELPSDGASGLTELPAANSGLQEIGGGAPMGGGLGDPLMGGDLSGSGPAPAQTMGATRRFGKQGNIWDSKYLLIGGGALLIISLAGFFMWRSLNSGNAAAFFKNAEEHYQEERYSQAVEAYEKFLKKFPKDENASTARVKSAMSRLRITVSTSNDPNQAMETSLEILPTIEEEEAFSEIRVELADLLPQIAEKFIDAAEQSSGDQAKDLVDKTNKCMQELVGNPTYIPSKLMRNIDTRLEPIRERLTEVERAIEREGALAEALADITRALGEGKTRSANETRKKLIDKYPRLEAHKDVKQAALDISAKEKELVTVKDVDVKAETQERKASKEVVPSSTTGKKIAELENQVAFVRAKNAVYGIEMSSGKVLWRRYIGNDAHGFDPVSIGTEGDALLVDHQNKEVVRVNAKTGKLVWRQLIKEPITACTVADDRLLVTTRPGRVINLDPKTGNSTRMASLPVPLAVGALMTDRRPQIYQVGAHSNVYALDKDSLECSEVYYIGHKAGTIDVPAIFHLGHLFICENRGSNFSEVHVLSTDRKGLKLTKAGKAIRMKGKVLVPPVIYGRNVLVVTDLGEVKMLKLDSAEDGTRSVATMFTLPPRPQQARIGYPMAFNGQLWLGDDMLTQYKVQLSRSQFSQNWDKFRGDTFVAPMQRFGNVILLVRQPAGSTGVAVSTIVPSSGDTIWETRVAVPGNVRVGEGGSVEALSAAGDLYRFNQGVPGGVATPTHSAKLKQAAAFTKTMTVAGGQIVLAPPNRARHLVLYSPKATNQMKLVELGIPGESSAAPIPFDKGVVFPMSNGQIFLVDPTTGKQLAHPFQPALAATDFYKWGDPVLLPGNEFVIGNEQGLLFVVTLKKGPPSPYLSEIAQLDTKMPWYRPMVAVGENLFLVKRAKGHDEIITYKRDEVAESGFKPGKTFALKGRVAWGPVKVGDQVFVAGDVDGLTCFNTEKQLWQAPLDTGYPSGPPIQAGADFLLTSISGIVTRINGASGKTIGKPQQLPEPLGAGGVVVSNQAILCGTDGVLHILPLESGNARKGSPILHNRSILAVK